MHPIVLAAIVTGVAADGVYIDEGSADGVRVGDTVTVGGVTLTVVDVSRGSARTGPPPDPFALRRGERAKVKKSGEASATAPVAPKPTPPEVDTSQAATWWSAAEDGWAEPRPSPRTTAPKPDGPTLTWRGVLGLRGTTTDTAAPERAPEYRGAAYSRLDVGYDRLWYAHDLRVNGDWHDGRYALPVFEAWRLEAGWRGEAWGARGGRMALGDLLAAGALDGAAVETSFGRAFVGFAPDPRTLAPEADAPQAGVAAHGATDLGSWRLLADVTALVALFRGEVDRTAVAPQARLVGGALTLTGFAEVDAGAPGRPALDATHLYLAADAALLPWLDAGARYARYRPPATRRDEDLPTTDDVRQDVWIDARVDTSVAGIVVPSFGLLDDPQGLTYSPGADWFVPLTYWLDAQAGWFMSDGPTSRIQHARGRLSARLPVAWPVELEAGARRAWIGYGDRETTETTLEAGGHVWLPMGAELHVFGERTAADEPRTLLFADLRWVFGP